MAESPELSLEFLGLKLENPVMPASGPPGKDAAALKGCAEAGVGAMVAKTISVEAAEVPRPNMAADGRAFYNVETWSEDTPEHWLERELPALADRDRPLLISLGYTAEQIAELVPRFDPFADAFELSTHYIGTEFDPMQAGIRAAKSATEKPVLVKLSPKGPDLAPAARAAVEAGADGIVAINSVGPTLAIDLESGKPLLGHDSPAAWLSGPCIKPLGLMAVHQIVNAVDVPVIGCGGITKGTDALEYITVGATAVQLCTAAIRNGPAAFTRVIKGMTRWMAEHHFENLEQVRGRLQPRDEMGIPAIHADDCTGCDLCWKACVYDAIEMVGQKKERKAILIEDNCARCGLCITVCPPRCIAA